MYFIIIPEWQMPSCDLLQQILYKLLAGDAERWQSFTVTEVLYSKNHQGSSKIPSFMRQKGQNRSANIYPSSPTNSILHLELWLSSFPQQHSNFQRSAWLVFSDGRGADK